MDINKPRIGIIGGGTMGKEISTFLIENKFPVLLKARKKEDIDNFLDSAQKSLKKLLRRNKISESEFSFLKENTIGTIDFDQRFGKLDIIIETIIEDFATKQSLYGQLEDICSAEAIICTNTSSLSVSQLSEGLKNRGRFLGIHFFQPFRAFNFIELVPGRFTEDRALDIARAFIKSTKKKPFVVKDTPGFFFNRVQLSNILEVFLALESGWHGLDELNQKFKESQFYLGILNSVDKLGVDVLDDSIRNCHKNWKDRFPLPQISRVLIEKKRLGEKCGKGFYAYDGNSPVIDTEIQNIMDGYRSRRSQHEYIFTPEIGIHRIMNEGIYCLEDGTADIDEAESIMCSVPPFLFIKGFYRAMDSMGLDVLYDRLLEYEKRYGLRYRPAPLLREMVAKGELGVKSGKGFFTY